MIVREMIIYVYVDKFYSLDSKFTLDNKFIRNKYEDLSWMKFLDLFGYTILIAMKSMTLFVVSCVICVISKKCTITDLLPNRYLHESDKTVLLVIYKWLPSGNEFES